MRERSAECDSLDFGCYMPCKLPELICTGLNALLSWFSYNKLGSLTVLYICFFVTIIRTSCFFCHRCKLFVVMVAKASKVLKV